MRPPYEENVSGKYGAPMGRHSDDLERFIGVKAQLRKVPPVDGDYDPGGAYWGGIQDKPLWCLWGEDDEESLVTYLRAPDREAALKELPEGVEVVQPTIAADKAPDAFVYAYEEAALWTSLGDDGEPLDDEHGPDDIDEESRAKMRADCDEFYADNANDLYLADDAQGGHDFWLTRVGSGVGFSDRPELYGEEQAERLDKSAEAFGDYDLYIGDDSKIHGYG